MSGGRISDPALANSLGFARLLRSARKDRLTVCKDTKLFSLCEARSRREVPWQSDNSGKSDCFACSFGTSLAKTVLLFAVCDIVTFRTALLAMTVTQLFRQPLYKFLSHATCIASHAIRKSCAEDSNYSLTASFSQMRII